MKYTVEDLYKDILYCNSKTKFSFQQYYCVEENVILTKIKKVNINSLSPEVKILLLPLMEQPLRNLNDTPYVWHLSYPSARSFYTIRGFVGLGNNQVISKIPGESQATIYSVNFEVKKNEIYIVRTKEIKEKIYVQIHNSLQALEAGHIIGSYYMLAKVLDLKFDKVSFGRSIDVIKLGNFKAEDLNLFQLDQLKKKYRYRSSGIYYGMLSNWIKIDNFKALKKIELSKISKCFGIEDKYCFYKTFENDGQCFWDKEKCKSLSYQNLQNKFSFWDPRYGSALTVFGITKVDCNISKVVELIGACAQIICLNNAKCDFINRPVKQIIPNKWEHMFEDSDIIPFYGVISTRVD